MMHRRKDLWGPDGQYINANVTYHPTDNHLYPFITIHDLQPTVLIPTVSWTTGSASILPRTPSYSFLSMQALGSVSDNRFVSLLAERPEMFQVLRS